MNSKVVGNATLLQSIAAVKLGGSIDIIGALSGAVSAWRFSLQLELFFIHCPPAQGDDKPPEIVLSSIGKELKIRGIYVGFVAQCVPRTFPFESFLIHLFH